MELQAPSDVGGYVLAGGKSSRMGRDKALLELAGKSLVLHAVEKLRRVCAEAHILSGRPELDAFAPLVPDLHPDCGPLGGFEAALKHSRYDWNLFMPVDMPFLPSAFLDWWVRTVTAGEKRGARVAMFTVEGRPQPALCMLHKDMAPFVRNAVARGEFKVFPVLKRSGRQLAESQGVALERAFFNLPWDENSTFFCKDGMGTGESWRTPTEDQQKAKHLWFVNLNTPEEFADADAFAGALDT